MYLSIATRPGIAFMVGRLASRFCKRTKGLQERTKMGLRYLNGSRNGYMEYSRSSGPLTLERLMWTRDMQLTLCTGRALCCLQVKRH